MSKQKNITIKIKSMYIYIRTDTNGRCLSPSFHVLHIILFALHVSRRRVVGHDVRGAILLRAARAHVCRAGPDELREVPGPVREAGLVEVVLLDLVVPHVCGMLARQLRAGPVRQVLPHILVVAVLQAARLCEMLRPAARSRCSLGRPAQRGRAVAGTVHVVRAHQLTVEVVRS